MRLALATAFFAASVAAAPAQSTEEPRLNDTLDRAFRDMVEDLRPALEETLDAMGPALEEAFRHIGPALEGALGAMRELNAVDDPRNYEAPEVLPNGDIIIRRRDDAPPFDPADPDDRRAPPFGPGGVRT